MKYISDIIQKSTGEHIKAAGFIDIKHSPYDFIVSDTEDKSLRELYTGDEPVIGYAVSDTGIDTAVVHTAKTASLHRFIESVHTTVHDVDKSTFECIGSFDVTVRGNIATVICSDLYFYTEDDCGSVANYLTLAESARCTLYDALVSLCRSCSHNLLMYDSIVIADKANSYMTEIRLIHGIEADRFFTKMAVLG